MNLSLTLTARQVGNSLGFTLPKEVVEHLHLKPGDSFYLTKNGEGYQLTAYNPQFVRELELAQEGMNQYKNALHELAK